MEALEAWLLAVEAGSDGPQQLEVVAGLVQQDPTVLATLVRAGALSQVAARHDARNASAATILVAATEEYAHEVRWPPPAATSALRCHTAFPTVLPFPAKSWETSALLRLSCSAEATDSCLDSPYRRPRCRWSRPTPSLCWCHWWAVRSTRCTLVVLKGPRPPARHPRGCTRPGRRAAHFLGAIEPIGSARGDEPPCGRPGGGGADECPPCRRRMPRGRWATSRRTQTLPRR